MTAIDARRAALDASATTFALMQMGAQRFTAQNLADLEADLDALREMCTQMNYSGKAGGHSMDEAWWALERVAASAMAAYLAGKLDTMEVDGGDWDPLGTGSGRVPTFGLGC